jgi:hypothetical protein
MTSLALDDANEVAQWNHRAAPVAAQEPVAWRVNSPTAQGVWIDGAPSAEVLADFRANAPRAEIELAFPAPQRAVPAAQWDGVDEALRCAEWLEHIAAGGEVVEIDGLARASAAELRRLHAQAGELRELLQDAKRAMTELHQAAIPDESAEGVPAIIPPEAFRKFVDAHAMLCFCMHQRGHNPPKGGQQHG